MPWKAKSIMMVRHEFVNLTHGAMVNFSELCRRFEISRKTGYKWVNRFQKHGVNGLVDCSRKPHRITFKVAKSQEDMIVALRQKHPTWGARKLRKKLQNSAQRVVPACSTITSILHRHGLINPGKGRQDWQKFEQPVANRLWQMDFKSPVHTLAGDCQPLTIVDDHSRFNVCLRALPNQKAESVQPTLEETFRCYGLPDRLLVDNGSPWGNDAFFRHTKLTAWIIRLGISVSHSRPYHPQTLGKDERFHRTLKEDLLMRYQWEDLGQMQEKFDHWRYEYNFERPHDSLDLAVPASRYQPSVRSFPEQLPAIEYPNCLWVRKVQAKGDFYFRGQTFQTSRAFRGYPVGIRPTIIDGVFDVLFCHEIISQIDLRNNP